MMKLTFSQIAVAAVLTIALALTPVAYANSLTFDHIVATYTLTSENAADLGTVTLVNAEITNSSATKTLTIQGFEFYLGGASEASVAAGDTPSQFTALGSGWTYSLGTGDLPASSTGTGWSKNTVPTSGLAVAPEVTTSKNYLTSISLSPDTSGSGYCFIGDVLAAGASCDVALLVTVNYGGVMGSVSNTFIYGYADGKMSGTGVNAGNDSQFQGLEETIHIDVAPEPGTLTLFGTGLLGLAGLVRSRFSRR